MPRYESEVDFRNRLLDSGMVHLNEGVNATIYMNPARPNEVMRLSYASDAAVRWLKRCKQLYEFGKRNPWLPHVYDVRHVAMATPKYKDTEFVMAFVERLEPATIKDATLALEVDVLYWLDQLTFNEQCLPCIIPSWIQAKLAKHGKDFREAVNYVLNTLVADSDIPLRLDLSLNNMCVRGRQLVFVDPWSV